MSTLPAIIVAVTNGDWISQVRKFHSQPFTHKGYRILVHEDPRWYHGDYGSVPSNHNFVVGQDAKSNLADKVDQSDRMRDLGIRIPRYTGLLDIGTSQEKTVFIDPNSYFGKLGADRGATTPDRYLLKATHGARGIGQVLVSGHIPPMGLIKVVNNHRKQVVTALDESSVRPLGEVLKEVFGDSVVYNTHGELNPHEGVKQMHSVFLQEYLPNISAEYRIITNAKGLPTYIQERNRVGTDYKQAVGSNANDKIRRLSPKDEEWQVVYNEVKTQVVDKGLVLPFHSMDIAYVDGELYVLEYYSQFGIEGIPPSESTRIAQEYITHKVDEYMRKYDIPDLTKPVRKTPKKKK